MKIIAGVMVLLAFIYFFPAFMSRTDEINGALVRWNQRK